MKNPDHQIMRWLDNEQSPEDRASFEAGFPGGKEALQAELGKNALLSGILKQGLNTRLTNEDFFNSRILEAIAPVEPVRQKSRLPAWLLPLLIPASAALAISAVSLLNSLAPAESTEVFAANVPEPEMTAVAFHVPDSEITVIWMDGLASVSSNPPH